MWLLVFWKWRWHVDDKVQEGEAKGCGKIVPLPIAASVAAAQKKPVRSELEIAEDFTRIITDVIDQSQWKATAERDMAALEDERVFFRRFLFSANRLQRKMVMELKHQKDLTDGEIRLLHWTANLHYSKSGAYISTPLVLVVWGGIMITYAVTLMIVTFALSIFSKEPSLAQGLNVLLAELILGASAYLVAQIYIQPWVIKQRTIAFSGSDLASP